MAITLKSFYLKFPPLGEINGNVSFVITYTFSTANASDLPDWQTHTNCTIYVSLYLVSMKYIPAALIFVFNVAIAWKLKNVWRRRQILRNRIRNMQSSNALSTRQGDDSR